MNSIGLGRPKTGKAQNKHIRESSSAYQLFDNKQLSTFKEAFNFLDQNLDGLIDKNDLIKLFQFLGQPLTPSHLDSLLSSRPSTTSVSASPNITFPIFLEMLAEQLQDLDLEIDLVEAFSCFDSDDKGWIEGDELRDALGGMGDRMNDAEIDRLLKGPFTDKNGRFHYRTFCETLRVSEIEPESIE